MTIAARLAEVRARIAAAAGRSGRGPETITLVAVTKTFGPDEVREAIAAGQRDFGENYVQEAGGKIEAVGKGDARWHFIGHLQTNKAKTAARLFDVIETVDSLDLARELDKRAAAEGRTLDALVQVNVAGEEQKAGIAPDRVETLLRAIGGLSALRVRGLMTMPPFLPPEEVRPYFRALRDLRDRLVARAIPGISLDALSMGMSGDFEAAIEEGATIVRVGTAIFGSR
jgi:pyridoxal phosphate enzyme (YggS family)